MNRFLIPLPLLLVALSCGRGNVPEEAGPAGGAVTLWTDSTELFMEHPALIVGAPDRFAIHLTDLTDFAPLRTGRVTLRFVPREGGEPLVVTQDAPRAPGIFGASPEFSRAGLYDLTMLVESPQARDSISIAGLRVYGSAAEAPRERESGGTGVSFLKEQQWKTSGFATVFADSGTVSASVAATGVIMAAAGREAVVSAPISGLVDAASVAASPAPGQRVAAGQVLALLMPSLAEGGGSPFAAARRELREAEDEYQRARRLYAAEAVPRRRLHEAEIRVQAAREALAGLPLADSLGGGGRLAVRSPIAGEVVSRAIAPGSRVDAGGALFTIIDASVVWLRVDLPADDATRAGSTAGATFRVERLPREYFATRLVSVGSVIDSLSRTVPVIYEVRNPDRSLRIGAVAQAAVLLPERRRGVVIPASAVLDEDGRPVAYVQTGGESFEKRALVLGGREGGRMVVASGIAAGERVVSGAAYQVRLASLSTAVPAHGHEH